MLRSKLALVDRGSGYLAAHDYDRALRELNAALHLDPEYVPALKNRGNVYLDTQHYDRAIEDHNQAIRLEPEYAEHFYNRGAGYFGSRAYDRAIEDFTKTIDLDFYDKALAWYARGIGKQLNGDPGGQVDIAQARALDPNVDQRPQARFFASFRPSE
jgi:tetratricopeptide (TPR) repeat protein